MFVAEFDDGTRAEGWVHYTADYCQHAREKSTGDVHDYCWQHDLSHCIVGLINGGKSVVLWNMAHGLSLDTAECEAEEKAAAEFQKAFFRR